jgi:lysophospholipase L1-like esterase
MKPKILFFLALFISQLFHAQSKSELKWWRPSSSSFEVIEGRAWSENLESEFDRFPIEFKEKVRKPVWNLSKNSAGLSIRFKSNSSKISIKYKLKGELAMLHMPATGVSGLDLYAKNSNGDWIWVQGQRNIAKESRYNFENLNPNDKYHKNGREYKLFLPLYNSIDSLQIGVPENVIFEPLAVRKEKPIVVYGTSIAQGACASRPGMAWTAILERKMDRPLINLGFSGNGRLEEEILNQIKEIEAKVFILDCLPNLGPNEYRTIADAKELMLNAVRILRVNDSITPILLVEHIGFSDRSMHATRENNILELNNSAKEAFTVLLDEGVGNLHLLTREEINLSIDATVDGIHPNDLGMQQYANAYEKKLRIVIKEPLGLISTTIPVTQDRDGSVYDWNARHQLILENNKKNPPKICFIGNSIVHQWGGVPNMNVVNGADSWKVNLEKLGVRNFGYGWDRIENVLWRVYHDELEGYKAEEVLIKISTNNLHLNTDSEIIMGLQSLISAVEERQPKAKIIMVGILPRRNNETRIEQLNLKIEDLAIKNGNKYLSIGNVLLKEDGKIDEELFRDGLHPNSKGYEKLGPLIKKYLMRKLEKLKSPL